MKLFGTINMDLPSVDPRPISKARLLTMYNQTASSVFKQGRAASLILLLLLAAFMGRAWMPAGFMPSMAADGSYELVICSGMGEKTIRVSSDGMPVKNQGAPQSGDGTCAFQLTSLQKIIPLIAFIILPLPETDQHYAAERMSVSASGIESFPYPARGPPAV